MHKPYSVSHIETPRQERRISVVHVIYKPKLVPYTRRWVVWRQFMRRPLYVVHPRVPVILLRRISTTNRRRRRCGVRSPLFLLESYPTRIAQRLQVFSRFINTSKTYKFLSCICVNLFLFLTLGPRGPFLQSGVEVVSQLAHLRARSESTVATFVALPRLGL